MIAVKFMCLMTVTVFIISPYIVLANTTKDKKSSRSECNYSTINGVEFTFAKQYQRENNHYSMWFNKPAFSKNGIPYEKYVGRSGKITKDTIDRGSIWKFTKAVMENCETIYCMECDDSNSKSAHGIFGVYLKDDLEKATQLINKNIWINNLNNAFTLKLITSDVAVSYPIENAEKVTVTGIVLESYKHGQPKGWFYIKVKKSTGEEGLISFSKDYFYENDPIPPGTPLDIVQHIQKNSLKIGMAPKYATLSWGKPEKINKTIGSFGVHEQWVYGNQYVYFENERLTSIQTSQ